MKNEQLLIKYEYMKSETMQNKKKCSLDIKEELYERFPRLSICNDSIDYAFNVLLSLFKKGGKLLVAGNGGSAADSEHITGELTKSFYFDRAIDEELKKELTRLFGENGTELSKHLEGALPVIPLTSFISSNTAFANDVDPKLSIAQLVNALGNNDDAFLGITTSGNSENIIKALMVAKAKGLRTLVLTGKTGGKCKELCETCICVPETETFKIQELHLPVYHALCLMLESELFDERK